MAGIGHKKLRHVSTVSKMITEAINGHFGCMEATHGAVTMWRNDDGLYCISEMRIAGYETTNALEAIALAECSVLRLNQPDR
jgi:hypothetical protein